MHKENAKNDDLKFQKQERIIKDLTDKINQAKSVPEKAKFAEELKRVSAEFLSCQDSESLEGKSYRFIANLRKKTADLIIKAKKLV